MEDYKPKIKKENLLHGVYYIGECRNATLARWHRFEQRFYHWRYKFGWFIETINCPEDEIHYDVFVTERVAEKKDIDVEIPFDEWANRKN